MNKDMRYFAHDSNLRNRESVLRLRMILGMEAYGIYNALREMLRNADDYRMRTHYESIAFELHSQCNAVRAVVEDYSLFEFDENFFWCNEILEQMNHMHEKSEKARLSAQKRWSKNERNANALQTESNRYAKEKKRKEKKIYNAIVECLNAVAGKQFKSSTPNTKAKIKARLNDGFEFEDFELVIKDRTARWKNTEYEQYLRPETLFGTRFEGYLNAAKSAPAKQPYTQIDQISF
jgi:uncharacterized phage protein (TIGR02220 family)